MAKASKLEAGAAARDRRTIAAQFSISKLRQALVVDAVTGARVATTPHGLIRQFDAGGPEHLLVAVSPSKAQLAFQDIQRGFKNALARNRLFLVLSRNTAQGFKSFSSRVDIAGWQFDLKIDGGPMIDEAAGVGLADRAIFIFKFDDRPLKDLLAHPEQWGEAEEFNADTAEVSRFLVKYFEDAQTSGRAEFRRIRRALDDPKWNGVLAVTARVNTFETPRSIIY